MKAARRAPNTIRTHWIMVKAFLEWVVAEGCYQHESLGEILGAADPALDRVREIVVPDSGLFDMLSQRLGSGQYRLVLELLLAPAVGPPRSPV